MDDIILHEPAATRATLVTLIFWLSLVGAGVYVGMRYLQAEDRLRTGQRWKGELFVQFMLLSVATLALAGINLNNERNKGITLPWDNHQPLRRSHLRESRNNAKNIGIAMHNFFAQHEELPGYYYSRSAEKELHGWQTHLLPYLDQIAIHREIDFDKTWDDPVNREVFQLSNLSIFTTREGNLPYWDEETGYFLTHYSANARLLATSRPVTIDELQKGDGASQTLMMGPITENLPPWAKPGNWRDPALGIDQSPHGFGSTFDRGAVFLMADGSVREISRKVDPGVLKALATPAGGEEEVNLDELAP